MQTPHPIIVEIQELTARARKAERERDEFERKGKELCCAYGSLLLAVHRALGYLNEFDADVYPPGHITVCQELTAAVTPTP